MVKKDNEMSFTIKKNHVYLILIALVFFVGGFLLNSLIAPTSNIGANPSTGAVVSVEPASAEKIYPLFIHQILISEKFQKDLNNISSSTTIKTIKAPELKGLKFAIPSLPEQKKIAEILTAVDEEIENEMAHKERLEGIKKGLMQVLLTGKIRAKI